MVGGRASTIIFYAACIVFGIVFAFIIMDWYFDAADLCGSNETTGECVREWFGAWSGYLAALAAGITLLALYDQIREQRKQTEFMVGDALPTMDIVQDLDDPEVLVIRLVNWNRRGVVAKNIELHGIAGGKTFFFEHKKNGEKIHHNRIYLRGWENRAEAPHSLQTRIVCEVDNELINEWPTDTEVTMTIQIIDVTHRIIDLRASLLLKDVAETIGIG